MPVNRLYATWFQFLRQLLPHERITRVRNLAALISGMALSRSVGLSHIAAGLPRTVQLLSVVRRLDRFLENPAFDVRTWNEPQVRQVLAERPGHLVRLIIDSTQVGFHQQWLVVALAYRRRALPLAWDWVPYARGHSPAAQQQALLTYVRTLLPAGRTVILVGDAEFGSVEVLRLLDQWGWHYVFRQKGKVGVHPEGVGTWHSFAQLARQAGSGWYPQWRLTRQHRHLTQLVIEWAPGQRHPWLLITNLPQRAMALHAYRQRMWIEELFGDVKGHGVHFEATHLRDPAKLSRLALAVVWLYLATVTFGTRRLQGAVCPSVDRRNRRDLSLFQIGWRLVQQRLVQERPLQLQLSPFRC